MSSIYGQIWELDARYHVHWREANYLHSASGCRPISKWTGPCQSHCRKNWHIRKDICWIPNGYGLHSCMWLSALWKINLRPWESTYTRKWSFYKYLNWGISFLNNWKNNPRNQKILLRPKELNEVKKPTRIISHVSNVMKQAIIQMNFQMHQRPMIKIH